MQAVTIAATSIGMISTGAGILTGIATGTGTVIETATETAIGTMIASAGNQRPSA
jgi:hypothetical protein